MTAQNPTPYYVTIIGLTNSAGSKITRFPGIMVAPKSSLDFAVTDGAVSAFSMMYVNDYGGHPELKFSCSVSTCKALPSAQQE